MLFQGIYLDLEKVFVNIIISFGIYTLISMIVRNHAKKKSWRFSFRRILLSTSIWLVVSLFFNILFSISLSENWIFDIIILGLNLGLGTFIFLRIYENNIKNIISLILYTQAIWYGLSFIFIRVPELMIIFEQTNKLLDGSKIVFIFSLIVIVSIISFLVNWGDRVQLIDNKSKITYLSILPAICILIYAFIELKKNFYENVGAILPATFFVSLIILITLKRISYRNIEHSQLQELTKLEKGKTVLTVENLKVHYPLIGGVLKRQIGSIKAVDGVSFKINSGETLGLVGESGCGKTTVAYAILNLVEKTEGKILFHNEPVPDEYSRDLRRKIQIVYQDPDASLNPRLKVVDIIAEPLKNILGITDKDILRRHVLKLLEQVSLKREHMDRYPHEFSGGQKQRIVIARALACNPELIILDECTSALDVSVQAQILNLLKDLQEEYGYAYLFITHNLAVVNHIADRVAVMYLGKIVEIGTTEQIFSNPTHPYTQALLASRSEIDPYNQEIKFVIEGEVPSPISPPSGCKFHPRCNSDARTKECEINLPHKIKVEEDHYIWCVNEKILDVKNKIIF